VRVFEERERRIEPAEVRPGVWALACIVLVLVVHSSSLQLEFADGRARLLGLGEQGLGKIASAAAAHKMIAHEARLATVQETRLAIQARKARAVLRTTLDPRAGIGDNALIRLANLICPRMSSRTA
jgi:hypothetical protein